MSIEFPPSLSDGARARLEEDALGFSADVARAIAPGGVLPAFFDAEREVTIGRSPGRLDFMGGIADYSGSLVLELPLADATFVAAQPAEDGVVRVASLPPGGGVPRVAELSVAALGGDYAALRRTLAPRPDDAWAGYVAGTITALRAEHGIQVAPRGARLLVASSLPEGSGVSSSAALTTAASAALLGMAGVALDGRALALVCQKAENLVVGAPSGVMDPMTTVLGEENRLLELLCQEVTVLGHPPVPPELELFGIDSGLRHAVTGADYGSVRVAAFMGYRIIADLAGLPVVERDGVLTVRDDRFGGYLANVGVAELEARYLAALPERLSGAEFLRRYRGITDRVTAVDPKQTYPVCAATVHPIREHERVGRVARLLEGSLGAAELGLLGDAMLASHRSYGACGLGSDGTDRLVALVHAQGPKAGLLGAKITGGGSGGTVAVLARAGAGAAVDAVALRYQAETGRVARVFRGSSPGAARFGAVRLRPDGGGQKSRREIVA
jgi:L-arabinokinase